MDKYLKLIENDSELRSQFNTIEKELEIDGDSFPLVIADNIVTTGLETTCNSKALEGYLSPFDADLVEKLKAKGGKILGKTGGKEFGVGKSENEEGNYYAVKELGVPGVLSDSRGEVLENSIEYGLYSLVPSFGLLSRHGMVSVASSIDTISLISKDLKDVRKILEIIQGKDLKDSCSIDLGYTDYTEVEKVEKAKVALLKDIDFPLGENIEIEGLEISRSVYEILSSGEYASNMERFDGIGFGYRSENYENLDELYKNSRSESLGTEVKEKILFGNFVLSKNQYDGYYDHALRARSYIANVFGDLFDKVEFLVLEYNEEIVIGARLAGLPLISTPEGKIVISKAFNEKRLLDFVDTFKAELGGDR